jgi:hypothetical protein
MHNFNLKLSLFRSENLYQYNPNSMNPKNYPPISSPEEIPGRFADAWNERDPYKLASLFDEDAEFVNVVGIWWHSREDIYIVNDGEIEAVDYRD